MADATDTDEVNKVRNWRSNIDLLCILRYATFGALLGGFVVRIFEGEFDPAIYLGALVGSVTFIVAKILFVR